MADAIPPSDRDPENGGLRRFLGLAISPRKRRWLRAILAAAVLGPLVVIAGLPWLLGTPPARQALVSLVNRHLSPTRVEVGTLRLSWLGSQSLTGVVLHDRKGKRVLVVPRATLDRSLVQLLLNRSNLGTLTLDQPAIDVRRKPDGSMDVVEAVSGEPAAPTDPTAGPSPSASKGLPDVDLTFKVVRGSLRFRSPELTEPLEADRFDLTVQMTRVSGPLSLKLRMEKGKETEAVSSLGLDGTYDLRTEQGTPAALTLNLLARRWPIGASVSGVSARGQLDGQLTATRKASRWDLKGDTRLLGLDVTGPALSGDRLQLDRVSAVWDVEQGAKAWSIRRMSLESPVATLSASAPLLGTPGTASTLDGRIDLAALARQLPHALRLREGLTLESGEARVRVEQRTAADARSQVVDLIARLSDLVAHDAEKTIALRTPASFAAELSRQGSSVKVERLAVASEFLQADGTGDLDQGIKIQGVLDLGALQAQVRDLIDFGAVSLAGRGHFTLDYRRNGPLYAGGFSSEFQGLDIKGLTTEPIHREAVKLDAAVSGPIAASGLPEAIGEAKAGLAAGQIGASATAKVNAGDATTVLTLVATGPLTLSEQAEEAARGELRFQGAWRSPALVVGDLRINLSPAHSPPEARAVALALRGRYDTSKGDVILSPIPGQGLPAGAVNLSGEGLRISGLGQPPGALKVEGSLAGDLAALDQLLANLRGSERYDLAGSWLGRVSIQPSADGRLLTTMRVESPDLSRGGPSGQPRTQEGPIALAFVGAYQPDGGRLEIKEMGMTSRYAALSAGGRIDDATGRRVADVQGTLVPNWQTLNALVATAVEPGASLQGGGPRTFRIKGPLSGDSVAGILRGLDAELGLDLAGARAYGLAMGPTPLVLRCGGGRALIDPIVTTMNQGRIDLRPEVVLDDPRGLALRLLPGSTLQDVAINDEVSQKILSFIAPILEQATQVHGRVSAAFNQAEFPIGGDESRTMAVTGNIVFNDVVFGAGPLGAELLSLAGKRPETALRLHQPVQLAIANRRISQSGLEIPINGQTRITVRGSVGFDQTLQLRADVPITSAMLGRDRALQEFVAGTTIPVPIGGTLTHPRADRQALAGALREVSRSLLKRGVEQEATDLLRRLTRDRGGPPRPR